MMSKLVYVLLLYLSITIGFAQNDSVNINSESNSIELFKRKKLLIRGFMGLKNYDFILKSSMTSTSDWVHYESIQQAFIGAGVHYDGLGGHLWIGLPFFRADKLLQDGDKGRGLDFQANFYKKRAIIDVNFQQYKGLYLLNPSQYNLPKDIKGDLFREDLKIMNTNGVFIYNFNPRFAIGSGFTQTGRQTKTTGSWLLLSSVAWDKFDADSNLVPQTAILYSKLQEEITYGDFISVSVGGGYGANLIYKKIFCTMFLTTGPALQWQNTNLVNREMKVNLHYNIRGAIGYNGDEWALGVSYVLDNHEYSFGGVNAHMLSDHFKVFIAHRFNYSLNEKIEKLIFR